MCQWSASKATVHDYGIAIDLRITVPQLHRPGSLPTANHSNAGNLSSSWKLLRDALLDLAKAAVHHQVDDVRTVRVIVPTRSGSVAQADWIQRRLIGCNLVDRVAYFLSPRARVKAHTLSSVNGALSDLMDVACAALLLAPTATTADVNSELAARLDQSWILSGSKIPRFRLAVVDGRRHRSVSSAGEGIYRAAAGLDIGLVVLDKPDHWLQLPEEQHLRDEFLPIDMTVDDGLVGRIVTAIRSCRLDVHGITTWTDAYLLPVAAAATILGLPGSPEQSVASCVDKSLLRLLPSNATSCQHYQFSSPDELATVIADYGEDIRFPMVLKPCSGTSSEGVFKINDLDQLRVMAVRNLQSSSIGGKYGQKMMLETFVEGPEVDVNLTMLDGEVLFSEISDDFPSPADSDFSDVTDTFVDTGNAMPSILPATERRMLVDACRSMLLDMDMRTGIFHCEARVNGSSMQYTTRSGLLDLHSVPGAQESTEKASCFIIEINARMPGNMGSGLIERLWGMDYYGLNMLFCVNDRARVRALAQPYAGGPRYHSQVLRLSATKGGVWKSEDPCRKLLDEAPDLRKHVAHYRNLYQRGMVVPDPVQDVVVCVAFLYIVSTVSREEMLRASQRVAELFDYQVE